MTRQQVFNGALKFQFQRFLLEEGKTPREAYRIARFHAATFAFHWRAR